jgi:hypothetical protein
MTNLIYTEIRFLVTRRSNTDQDAIRGEVLIGCVHGREKITNLIYTDKRFLVTHHSKPDQDAIRGEVLLGCVRERERG